MGSADFSLLFSLFQRLWIQEALRSPRVRHYTFPLIPAESTFMISVRVSDFVVIGLLIHHACLIRFLFIGSAFCFQLPSDSTSRWTPLPSANCSPLRASKGLSPSSLMSCRAHLNSIRSHSRTCMINSHR
jgi:hypothetical protein